MRYKWSVFTVRYSLGNGEVLLKNFLTGSIVKLEKSAVKNLDSWLRGQRLPAPNSLEILSGENGLLVPEEKDEFCEYRDFFLRTRNEQANLFTLHFLPTMKCQLNCSYCFECGVRRQGAMSASVFDQSVRWLKRYLEINPEVSSLKCVMFGGEPLLVKGLVDNVLSRFKTLVENEGKEYWTEITTNGVLLDENAARMLKRYNLRRIQITLDGPRELHDSRRVSRDKYPTFDKIISNVRMLLDREYVPRVNLRLSLDEQTADSLPDLIRYLAGLGYGDKIHLSLGLVVPSLDTNTKTVVEKKIAEKAVDVWRTAKECGFTVPDEFLVGPWCVAIAKHSAVIQPNGSLQKCFCTVGRPAFDFGRVSDLPTSYAQDVRFEKFSRTDKCAEDKCPYLPICGSGCIHDSIVKNGEKGFGKRFCQKDLIATLNRGLLLLKYGSLE